MVVSLNFVVGQPTPSSLPDMIASAHSWPRPRPWPFPNKINSEGLDAAAKLERADDDDELIRSAAKCESRRNEAVAGRPRLPGCYCVESLDE